MKNLPYLTTSVLLLLILLQLILSGCHARYAVMPGAPNYFLKSPDGLKRSFPESTSSFDNTLEGWIDLKPAIALTIEKAYFSPPESRRILDYRGLESAQYQYFPPGLIRRIAYTSLKDRPDGQSPVSATFPADQLLCRHHRFFFQVVLNKEFGTARALLLSGDSKLSLTTAATHLTKGEGCPALGQDKLYCTAIPENISASIQFEIRANGKPRLVLWRSTVASAIGSGKNARLIALRRSYRGKMIPVTFNSHDPESLRLPLWPGDDLKFEPQ